MTLRLFKREKRKVSIVSETAPGPSEANLESSALLKNATQWPQSGLNPLPLDNETRRTS